MEPMDGFATVTCERDLVARLHEEAISSGMLIFEEMGCPAGGSQFRVGKSSQGNG
jgi:hypothetical protein